MVIITHIVTATHKGDDVYEIAIQQASTPGVAVTIGIQEFKEKLYPSAVGVENGLQGRIRMRTGGLPFDKTLLASNLNALLNSHTQGLLETEVQVEFADPSAERKVREQFATMPPEVAQSLLRALNEQYGIRQT